MRRNATRINHALSVYTIPPQSDRCHTPHKVRQFHTNSSKWIQKSRPFDLLFLCVHPTILNLSFYITKLNFQKNYFDNHCYIKKKMSNVVFPQIQIDTEDNLHKNTARVSSPLCNRVGSCVPVVR